MLFTREMPFEKFIKVLVKTKACSGAIDWAKGVDLKIQNCTFGQGIDELPEVEWAKYCLETYKKWFDEDVIESFEKVARE